MSRPVLLIYRLALLCSMIIIVLLGYWVRFRGVFPEWLNDALGSLAYEIFWILLVVWLLPRAALWQVALGVCLATCAIEFLQLYQPDWLQALRRTLPGRLVLGNQFSWADFPAYVVGSLAGVGWLKAVRSQVRQRVLSSRF
jgi:Protein of unknown function (DUF2809)